MVARLLSGEASPEETRATLIRLETDAEFRREFEQARAMWNDVGGQPLAWDSDNAWTRLSMRMRSEGNVTPLGLTPTRDTEAPVSSDAVRLPWWRSMPWTRIAAAAAVLVAIASGVVAAPGISQRAEGPPSISTERVYRTVAGQRATVMLTDGSQVELGPVSSLHIRRLGTRGPRELQLIGEAVFHVVHDSERPFLVYSGNSVTEDLGTRFSVRAYENDTAVRVVVAEGSVTLRAAAAPGGSGTVLRPGDLANLDRLGRVGVTSGIDAEAYLGWANGRIVFRDEALSDVATQIGRMFGAIVIVPDSNLQEKKVTLDMPNGSLGEVLDVLSTLLQTDQTRDGLAYVLGPSRPR